MVVRSIAQSIYSTGGYTIYIFVWTEYAFSIALISKQNSIFINVRIHWQHRQPRPKAKSKATSEREKENKYRKVISSNEAMRSQEGTPLFVLKLSQLETSFKGSTGKEKQ